MDGLDARVHKLPVWHQLGIEATFAGVYCNSTLLTDRHLYKFRHARTMAGLRHCSSRRTCCRLRAAWMVCTNGSTPTCAPAGRFLASQAGGFGTPGASAFCKVQSGPSSFAACAPTSPFSR